MILPPLSMDLGLLLISIGVVNLWKAREKRQAGFASIRLLNKLMEY